MNSAAKECFSTAVSLLRQVIGNGRCTTSEAEIIVESIALGAIRWGDESTSNAIQGLHDRIEHIETSTGVKPSKHTIGDEDA